MTQHNTNHHCLIKEVKMSELRRSIEDLKKLEKNQLCYSYQEVPEMYRDGKPIYTNDWLWCHGANWYNLHEITKRYGYSNAVFEEGKRTANNIAYLGNILIYDYDDGITIDEMKKNISDLGVSALIVTTLNHQKKKKGVTCDRFRLIFQLQDCIGDDISTPMMEEILQEVDNALDLGGVYDEACKTIERFYSPAPTQEHYYFEGMTLDISDIVADVKNPKPKPIPRPRITGNYADSGLSLKEMRDFINEHITYNIVVRELEGKGLSVSRNGGIYLDRKKVGNIHPETRFIRNWAESESLDIVGVLNKFYNEDYIENTKRLYEELK